MSSSSIVSAGPADLDIPGGTCYFQVNGPHCPAVLHVWLIFIIKQRIAFLLFITCVQLPTMESCIYLEAITPVSTDTSMTSGNSILVRLEKTWSCHNAIRKRPTMMLA